MWNNTERSISKLIYSRKLPIMGEVPEKLHSINTYKVSFVEIMMRISTILSWPHKTQVKDGLTEEFCMPYHLSKFEQIGRFWTICPTPLSLTICFNCLLIEVAKLLLYVSNDCWNPRRNFEEYKQQQRKFFVVFMDYLFLVPFWWV